MKNTSMSIQVLGAGCSTCERLYDLVAEAVKEIKLDTQVEYITDVKKIIEMGVSQLPALVLDGNLIIAGFVPSKEEIKLALTNYIAGSQKKSETIQKSGDCNCGGNC